MKWSAVLLAFWLSGCGARTNLDEAAASTPGSPPQGAGEPAGRGGGENTSGPLGTGPAPIPKDYPSCTGSGPMSGPYFVNDLRVRACAWQSSEVPDPSQPLMVANLTETLSLTFVSGLSDCARVGGQGWFRLPTIPGKVGDAPVLITIGVCPDACAQIGSAWAFAFTDLPCAR